MFLKRGIMFSSKSICNYDLHIFEDILLIDGGKKSQYSLEVAGKIAILAIAREKPQIKFEPYKFENGVEESFDVFKNLLQVAHHT
jgi:hypothetical protein